MATTNQNLNTTENVFKGQLDEKETEELFRESKEENKESSKESKEETKKSDEDLTKSRVRENKKQTAKTVKRVPFKCEVVYHALYPNGFTTTVQGIVVNLIFDGRTVMLPEWIAKFVKAKINKKAESEIGKRQRNANPEAAMEFLGRDI